MEKAENVNVQKVQNEAAGEPSPNTKRRLKLHLKGPKLHINIPFFKHGHHHNLSMEDEMLPNVSQSLPSESHMPSNFRDLDLCRECEDDDNKSDDKSDDNSSSEEMFLLEQVSEDEPESEKHQSDLEENEKDANSEEPQKQVQFEVEGSKTSADKAPVPIADKRCLKSCLKKTCQGRPRANTYPGPADCLEASCKRHVSFSPDTVDPPPRNCTYREWIEKKCPHSKGPSINIKHEKRKCQLDTSEVKNRPVAVYTRTYTTHVQS